MCKPTCGCMRVHAVIASCHVFMKSRCLSNTHLPSVSCKHAYKNAQRQPGDRWLGHTSSWMVLKGIKLHTRRIISYSVHSIKAGLTVKIAYPLSLLEIYLQLLRDGCTECSFDEDVTWKNNFTLASYPSTFPCLVTPPIM